MRFLYQNSPKNAPNAVSTYPVIIAQTKEDLLQLDKRVALYPQSEEEKDIVSKPSSLISQKSSPSITQKPNSTVVLAQQNTELLDTLYSDERVALFPLQSPSPWDYFLKSGVNLETNRLNFSDVNVLNHNRLPIDAFGGGRNETAQFFQMLADYGDMHDKAFIQNNSKQLTYYADQIDMTRTLHQMLNPEYTEKWASQWSEYKDFIAFAQNTLLPKLQSFNPETQTFKEFLDDAVSDFSSLEAFQDAPDSLKSTLENGLKSALLNQLWYVNDRFQENSTAKQDLQFQSQLYGFSLIQSQFLQRPAQRSAINVFAQKTMESWLNSENSLVHVEGTAQYDIGKKGKLSFSGALGLNPSGKLGGDEGNFDLYTRNALLATTKLAYTQPIFEKSGIDADINAELKFGVITPLGDAMSRHTGNFQLAGNIVGVDSGMLTFGNLADTEMMGYGKIDAVFRTENKSQTLLIDWNPQMYVLPYQVIDTFQGEAWQQAKEISGIQSSGADLVPEMLFGINLQYSPDSIRRNNKNEPQRIDKAPDLLFKGGLLLNVKRPFLEALSENDNVEILRSIQALNLEVDKKVADDVQLYLKTQFSGGIGGGANVFLNNFNTAFGTRWQMDSKGKLLFDANVGLTQFGGHKNYNAQVGVKWNL